MAMRWTIPTLIQQLVDQGIRPRTAGRIVAQTYPETRGDTFYRWADPDDHEAIAVGVYGLWNRLRGDQMPLGGTLVSDDARTIAQFLRLNPRGPDEIVRLTKLPDIVIERIANRTVEVIEDGGYFTPVPVEEEPMRDRAAQRLTEQVAETSDAVRAALQSIANPR